MPLGQPVPLGALAAEARPEQRPAKQRAGNDAQGADGKGDGRRPNVAPQPVQCQDQSFAAPQELYLCRCSMLRCTIVC